MQYRSLKFRMAGVFLFVLGVVDTVAYRTKMLPRAPAKIAAPSPEQQLIKNPKITLYALLTLISLNQF